MKTVAIVEIPTRSDERGSLSFLQGPDLVPFGVERIFYLYGVQPGQQRGGHAHRAQRQFLVALNGSFRVQADSSSGSEMYFLDTPSKGLLVEPMTWLKLSDFSSGSVCLVLCSGKFDESDYIRDQTEFENLVRRR